MKRALHIIDKTSEYTAKAFSFLIVVITVVIAIEVVARYILNSPTIWAQELAILINGVYFVIGGGFVLLANEHVRMDILVEHLSPRKKAILSLITAIVFFFVFIGIIVWQSSLYGWTVTQRLQTTGSTFNAPIWPTRLGLVLASIVLLFQGIATFIRDFNTAVTGEQSL